MKNTTMLKAMLLKYSISVDMDDYGNFKMTLTDKQSGKTETVEAGSWTQLIRKAYSQLLLELKKMEKRIKRRHRPSGRPGYDDYTDMEREDYF